MSLHAVLAPSPVTGVRASWRRMSPVPRALADVPPLRYRLPAEIITSAESERIMALTGKQVRQLRALAHHLNPVVHIGKADVTDAIAKQAEEALRPPTSSSSAPSRTAACSPAVRRPTSSPSLWVPRSSRLSATVSPCIVRAAVRTSSTSSSIKALPAAGRTNAPPSPSLTHQEAHHRVRLLLIAIEAWSASPIDR